MYKSNCQLQLEKVVQWPAFLADGNNLPRHYPFITKLTIDLAGTSPEKLPPFAFTSANAVKLCALFVNHGVTLPAFGPAPLTVTPTS